MTDLENKIQDDFKIARKERDYLKVAVLAMLKSAILYEAIALKKKEIGLNEEELLKVVRKEIRKRKEAAEEYSKASRPEAAEKEIKEAVILEQYLPARLSEDDIGKIIADKAKTLNIRDKSDFGRLMGAVMGEVGSKAEGGMVKRLVEEFLENHI